MYKFDIIVLGVNMKVKINKLDNFGRGITYINDKICFVKDALPEEEVDITFIKEKSKYLEAQANSFITKSPLRIGPKCPYYNECGGCNLEHISLEEENKFKIQKVNELLRKFTDYDIKIECIKSNSEYNYRNKIILHSDGKVIGLYKDNSNDLISIDKCLLVNDKINYIINFIKDINNIKSIEIRTSNDEKEVLLNIIGDINDTDINKLLDVVDVLIVNNKVLSKKSSIITNIGNKKYYLSNKSFFQVNKETTKDLYDEVLNVVKSINPNKVLDLYCGTGSIGIYVSKYAKEIIGIEESKEAIEDANKNKILNSVDNISFINNKVEDEIDKFNNIDLIIVDPPRSGLDTKTKEQIKLIGPNSIIYVSCDPVTLMRDIKGLSDIYELKSIKLFNMFPRTYHCESVSVLERRNVEK